ncbi:type IV pilin-like G/H family protein [Microcoleus sp. F8-D3]
MTNPQNNSNLAPWKWALIGGCSTLALALAGFGLYNLLNPQTSSSLISTSTSTSVAAANPENYVAQQLLGQWELQGSGPSVKLIFTPEGKLFIWDKIASASEARYQTNLNAQPKHLDILRGGQITKRAIFDFTAEGKLRLELDNTGTSRPTSFTSNAGLFNKISEQTILPPNVRATSPEDEEKDQLNKAIQSEAKQYVGSLNKAQQAFYAENSRFASRIEQLGTGIKSETQNYLYSILVSNDKRWVQAIALAKVEEPKNYTGITLSTTKASGETNTKTILCESNQPSKEPPGLPVIINNTDINCPSGYRDLSKY